MLLRNKKNYFKNGTKIKMTSDYWDKRREREEEEKEQQKLKEENKDDE